MMNGLITALLWVTGVIGGWAAVHLFWFVYFCPPALDDDKMRFRDFVMLWMYVALATCFLFNLGLEG